MANNKNPNEKLPGENAAGKHHYNPGNMSGKTIGMQKKMNRRSNPTLIGHMVGDHDHKKEPR